MKNSDLLKAVCSEIKENLDRLVLVCGCATELLITDKAAPPPRQTLDVDMVIEVVKRAGYYDFETELRLLGFSQSADDSGVICRWKKGILSLDVMPTDEKILGFSNPWYRYAVKSPLVHHLDKLQVFHVNAPCFLATKLAAFKGRGGGDFQTSHDLEDIISILDGRPSVVREIHDSEKEVKNHIKTEFSEFLDNPRFRESIIFHIPPDDVQQQRIKVVLHRLKEIVAEV